MILITIRHVVPVGIMSMSILLLSISLLSSQYGSAFCPLLPSYTMNRPLCRTCDSGAHQTACWAKRRRKGGNNNFDSTIGRTNDSNNDDDEKPFESRVEDDALPDFDFVEKEGGDKIKNQDIISTSFTTSSSSSFSSNDLLSNTQDLLKQRNRELERKMSLLQQSGNTGGIGGGGGGGGKNGKVDDPSSTVYLPSMVEYIDSKKGNKKELQQQQKQPLGTPGNTNKKNRKKQMQEKKEEEANFFIKFLFGEDIDKKDDIGILTTKIVEKSAWTGIIILVLWEIYLNSPLFQREAPLIPFVFRSEPTIF